MLITQSVTSEVTFDDEPSAQLANEARRVRRSRKVGEEFLVQLPMEDHVGRVRWLQVAAVGDAGSVQTTKGP
jgi:hypothetical protein